MSMRIVFGGDCVEEKHVLVGRKREEEEIKFKKKYLSCTVSNGASRKSDFGDRFTKIQDFFSPIKKSKVLWCGTV